MVFNSQVLPTIKIKIKGIIKEAIGAYRKKMVPMRAMLIDFLAVKSKSDLLAEAENPWAYFYKGIEGHEVESGVSHDETLFRFAAMSLKKEKPTDVIDAAFYTNKKRNDYCFELGYLIPRFIENTDCNDRILVVNPSPGMICAIEETDRYSSRYYAVVDETIAKLYKLQFPDAEFCTFDTMQSIKDIDSVLITNRDQKVGAASLLLECLSCCKKSATVIGLVPCVWLDNPNNGAYKEIKRNGFVVKKLLLVDKKATASSPRKKMIMILEKGEAETIETFQSLFEEKTRMLSVSEDAVPVSADSYLNSDKTILSFIQAVSESENQKKAPIYQKAEEYKFSDKISLFYKIYSERKNRFAGVAHYKEVKDVNLKTWGRRLSADIEKGLRFNSKEEVIGSLETLVFDESLYPIIRADIKNKYIDTKEIISLKTLWFYCWFYITDLKKYDHEYVAELFMKDEVSRVYPQIQSGNEIIKSLANSLGIDEKDIPYKAVLQIDIILRAAVEHRILLFDPLESFVADYTSRATERQQDVRNALVKKHYLPNEEMKIFNSIVKLRRVGGRGEFSCTLNSLLLAVAIRLFTGMAIRETAALKWSDFVPIEGTDYYQFKITRFVDAKGRLMHHAEKENWKRFRRVPSAKVLSFLLNERKRFLLDNGIDEEYLQDCPIILENNSLGKMKDRKTINHCKPGIISTFSNEIIKMADIPENKVILPDAQNDMMTDLSRYHGDIFLSNFRHQSNHTALMTMGEINYMIGISAPNTFSNHYTDYSDDFMQIGIIQKLCRWEYCYELIAAGKVLKEPTWGTVQGSGVIVTGPFRDGVAAVDLLIEGGSSEVNISVSSTHGIEIIKTEY